MKQQTRGSLMLLLCAMVWGAAFVAQSEGMNYVGPFTMQATRYFLSGLVLLPVIALRDKKGISVRPSGMTAKRQLLCGVVCGARQASSSSMASSTPRSESPASSRQCTSSSFRFWGFS